MRLYGTSCTSLKSFSLHKFSLASYIRSAVRHCPACELVSSCKPWYGVHSHLHPRAIRVCFWVCILYSSSCHICLFHSPIFCLWGRFAGLQLVLHKLQHCSEVKFRVHHASPRSTSLLLSQSYRLLLVCMGPQLCPLLWEARICARGSPLKSLQDNGTLIVMTVWNFWTCLGCPPATSQKLATPLSLLVTSHLIPVLI